jgi:ATP-dependent 26S proteasome regulatory subunit
MMHRFLNVGDGLVTTKGKKMIFSTNLPSIRDIDSALVRPGRCFDIVTFAPLEVSEAQALADALEVNQRDRLRTHGVFDRRLHRLFDRHCCASPPQVARCGAGLVDPTCAPR